MRCALLEGETIRASFFMASVKQACAVRSIDNLPDDPIGESLALSSLGPLHGLAAAVGLEPRAALKQLRDTTCQSFPVWCFTPAFCNALAALPEDRIDETATDWREEAADSSFDSDLYVLSTQLQDLRSALADRGTDADRLFVLLEETAF